MSTRADFASLDAYIDFRNADNEYQRRWRARHPCRVRVHRARNHVQKLDKSIDRQRHRKAELEALLKLPESTLAFVHETCKANIRAELQKLEARLQETIKCHSRAVARLEEL